MILLLWLEQIEIWRIEREHGTPKQEAIVSDEEDELPVIQGASHMDQCQENTPVDIHIDVLCAWCLHEQGCFTPEHQKPDDSHGICPEHAEEEYEKFRASKVKP
jgi:hypothetical protein